MTVEDAINSINYELRGTDDDTPVDGDDNWNYWLDKLNRIKNRLYKDVTKRWDETWSEESLGTITATATPSFSLPTTFLGASNDAYVTTTGDKRIDIEIIKPEERNPNIRRVYIASKPQKLYFTDEIESGENIVGGTLYLPGWYLPADYDAAADTLVFPSDEWAIVQAAAELALNDIIYEDKAADLQAKANSLYKNMLRANRKGTYKRPEQTPTNVTKITGPTRD